MLVSQEPDVPSPPTGGIITPFRGDPLPQYTTLKGGPTLVGIEAEGKPYGRYIPAVFLLPFRVPLQGLYTTRLECK